MSMALLPELLVAGLLIGAVYAAASIGLSLTMGVLRVFNVTHGIVIMAAGLLMAELDRDGVPLLLAAAIAILAAFLIGMAIDRLLQLPGVSENFGGLLVLFGAMVLFESLASLRWGNEQQVINTDRFGEVLDLGFMRVFPARLIAAGIALAGALVLLVFLERSSLGRAIRAIAHDPDAARILGIPVSRVSRIVFGIGTAFAALGGVSIALVFSFAPPSHFRWLVWAILIVVLGGMGSIRGTILAALGLGMFESLAGALIRFQYLPILVYGLLVAVLYVKRDGLAALQERRV